MPTDEIRSHARVLGLRLQLGVLELAALEAWARQAFQGEGSALELAELCEAGRLGAKAARAHLALLGGPVDASDLVYALRAVKLETGEDLWRLAENLDPILKELSQRQGLPDMLKPALTFAADFRHARRQADGSQTRVERKMRELLQALKQRAGGLPHGAAGEAREQRAVSAIVVSYRTGEALLACLAALEADAGVDEIIMVDNGNPQEMLWRVDELAASSKKLKLTGGGQNRGFAAGVNLGVKAASGGRLLLVNPDAVLQAGSVVAMEAALAGWAEPVVVGGRIYGPDGKEQRGGRRRRLTIESAAATFLGMTWLKALNPRFVDVNRNGEPQPDGPVPMDAVSGALMYLSRASFERLGGFDEGYFLHVEDIDLCRRAQADGGAVIYTPFASALHHGATSDAPAIAIEKHKASGLSRYFKKFAKTPGERLAASVVAPAIIWALMLRATFRRR